MAVFNSRRFRWILTALLGSTFAASPGQVVISEADFGNPWRAPASSARRVIKYDGGSAIIPAGVRVSLDHVNKVQKTEEGNDGAIARFFSFDDYWPETDEDWPNGTYTSDFDGFLNLNQFNVFHASEANEKGYIHSKDLDCAASKPFALYNTPVNYSTPSVIQSNATNLAEAGLSEFFDVIAWSWKPLGPYPDDLEDPFLLLDLYRIESGGNYAWVDGGGDIWDAEEFLEPRTWVPADIFYGEWGRGVNWMEFTTGFWEDSQTGSKSFDFCVDNVVLLFHKKEE